MAHALVVPTSHVAAPEVKPDAFVVSQYTDAAWINCGSARRAKIPAAKMNLEDAGDLRRETSLATGEFFIGVFVFIGIVLTVGSRYEFSFIGETR